MCTRKHIIVECAVIDMSLIRKFELSVSRTSETKFEGQDGSSCKMRGAAGSLIGSSDWRAGARQRLDQASGHVVRRKHV